MRTQQENPTVTIDTPVGQVRIQLINEHHFFVRSPGEDEMSLTVRGSSWRLMQMRLENYGEGAFELMRQRDANGHLMRHADHRACSIQRWNSRLAKHENPSASARTFLANAIVLAINRYIDGHPELLGQARAVSLHNDAARLEREIAQLKGLLDEKRAELAKIEREEKGA